jgi:hypothetical protein
MIRIVLWRGQQRLRFAASCQQKLRAGQLFDGKCKASVESCGRKGLIEEQEQRKNKRRKATWGYSTAERAKS